MLLEVIQARPSFVWTRTVFPETHIHHLWSTLGLFVMNTLFMAGEIVNSPEPFFSGAIRLIALEQLSMPSFMFSKKSVVCKMPNHDVGTYLLSEGHFPTHEQEW